MKYWNYFKSLQTVLYLSSLATIKHNKPVGNHGAVVQGNVSAVQDNVAAVQGNVAAVQGNMAAVQDWKGKGGQG